MKELLYVLLLFTVVTHCYGDGAKATSGPYKTTVVRAERCNKTTYPLDPDPPFTSLLEVSNSSKKRSLLQGNLIVLRDNKQIKLKTMNYIWKNGQWKLISFLNNIGCHGVLFHSMMVALGLKYDRETCGFLKGSYYFHDIDIDALQHILASQMEYGRLLRVSETMRGYVTYSCWEFESLIEPIKS